MVDPQAVDALGPVPYQPTDVVVKKKVPYHDLKVPQQYRLMGYRAHNVHDASRGYIPVGLMRTLRTGAEDEVIDLPLPKLQLPPDAVSDDEVETPAAVVAPAPDMTSSRVKVGTRTVTH